MKTASAGLIAHLAQEVTTLAWLWKVTRRDLAVYGFTTHDRDLVIGGVTYSAESGFLASAAQSKLGASVDNLDIQGAISSDVITAADILAGLWDGARVVVSVCNWADLSQGTMIVQTGTLGNIQAAGTGFTCEIRSLSQALQNTIGRVITRRCDANLGDTRCGVNLATYTVTGTATANSTDGMTFTASDLPATPGGLLTWTSGNNSGRAMEIKQATAGSITLALPMPYAIAASDAYTASSGCDKNLSTCRDTYSNAINFRGCPHIPGPDAVLAYPDAS
jgi:uncharacterized phage protein (TIGR02218 family)